ncbi:hypothetical protein HanHA89_Chr08g0290911 [Helianthus annuus]|nr:hypothetical protein HanHA89_Chr08g0290911 [Helianthus annuus]
MRVKPEKMELAEWNVLDKKAMVVITLALTRNMAFKIMEESPTYGMMKALSSIYEKPFVDKMFLCMPKLVMTRTERTVTSDVNKLNSSL